MTWPLYVLGISAAAFALYVLLLNVLEAIRTHWTDR
jgi:hypothetical protein